MQAHSSGSNLVGNYPERQAIPGHIHLNLSRFQQLVFRRKQYIGCDMHKKYSVFMHKARYQDTHVARLYDRLRASKNRGKAAGAVGRHAAEASWWMLKKKQTYREPAPALPAPSSDGTKERDRMSICTRW